MSNQKEAAVTRYYCWIVFLMTGVRHTEVDVEPFDGEIACSRISTHLSVGALSVREVWQRTLDRRQVLKEETGRSVALRSLKSFQSRLHWHCHFIQKLESEPRLEFEELHRGFIGLRQGATDREIERMNDSLAVLWVGLLLTPV